MPVSCPSLKETAASQMANEATNPDITNLTKAMNTIKSDQNSENSSHNYEDTTVNVAAENVITATTINSNNTSNPDSRQCSLNHNQSLTITSPANPAGRDRKGTSYVWNYCEKLSRHTVRCRLCHKIMSFHGTANIITHLQRRHNIMGDNVIQSTFPLMRRGNRNEEMLDANGNGVDNGVAGSTGAGNGGGTFDPMMITDLMDDMTEENDHLNAECNNRFSNSTGNSNRKSLNSTSVVWRYCKRISQDQVRCCFCKKYLSYQGTSNLQRHLHRMHGVVTQGRCPKANFNSSSSNNNNSNNNNNRDGNNSGVLSTAMENGEGAGVGGGVDISGHVYYPVIKEENIRLPSNLDFIWQFCSHHDLSAKVKCNMCDMSFMNKDTLAIAKHLTMIHGVEPSNLHTRDEDGTSLINPAKWRHRNTLDFENSEDGHYDDYSNLSKWNKIVTEKNDVVSHHHHHQQQQQQQQEQQQQQLRHPVIYGENHVKKDDSLFYDELIEEDRDDHFPTNRYDEEPFDPSILENLPEINPLSVRSSSGSHSPDVDSERIHQPSSMFPLRLPYGRFPASGDPQLLKLQKDCLRMETEYYREKAGFFRMQKHLTALQAKKVRLELERLTRSQSNPNPCATSNSSIFNTSGE